MEHEPFYTSGTYSAPEMGVYGGWVALEDSFAAGQVFFNERQDIALLFSGECFVSPETRNELRQRGHELGGAPGSWLVHFYEEHGEQFFEKLNGVFSGLLIDKRRKRAFLFNDRYGLERIYVCETKDGFYFASETKALLRVLPELRAFDEEGVAQFLTFGCTLEWKTLFRNIGLVPGGSVWSFENGNCHRCRYFSPETWESQPTLSVKSFESEFEETFQRILPRYFESESKIGISLTGGLDTRMIMACRPPTEAEPVCYTFAGDRDTLDSQLSARVAAVCGLEHQTLRIDQSFFSDFAAHADRTVYNTDGCFGILGAHEIYLNKLARHFAPVRVTGVCGGEILRRVSASKAQRLCPRLFHPEFGRAISISSQLIREQEHPVTSAAFKEVPWHLFGSLAASRSQVRFRTPYLDNEVVALAYQAPDSLRASPISAIRLIENNSAVLTNIPTDMGRMGGTSGLASALRRVASQTTFKLDYFHNEGLPDWMSHLDPFFRYLLKTKILGLHKYLHYRSWFRRELAGYLNDVITDARTLESSFWNSGFLEQMAREHINGRKNHIREINAVLTLEAVERLLFKDLSREIPHVPNSKGEAAQKASLMSA
jgi:asparagine synthase (glutamine-hydrolysing)